MNTTIDKIAENLMTIQPLLHKNLFRSVREVSNLTPGGLFVLGLLKREGKCSMTEISRLLVMPKPHVTLLIDRLIEEGFVVRKNDPSDRRVILIDMTEKGRSDFEQIKLAINSGLKERLNMLSSEQAEMLLESSQLVREILYTILHSDCCDGGQCKNDKND